MLKAGRTGDDKNELLQGDKLWREYDLQLDLIQSAIEPQEVVLDSFSRRK
jgi:hypothetical protein